MRSQRVPIRDSSSNGSLTALASLTTLAAIAPTVRQATRINSITAVFDVCRAPGSLRMAGVVGVVACPRHRSDRHPVLDAVQAWRVGLDEHPDRPGMQRPPPAPALTVVIARTALLAAPAPACRVAPQAARHRDLAGLVIKIDTLDHHTVFDAEHARPYPL